MSVFRNRSIVVVLCFLVICILMWSEEADGEIQPAWYVPLMKLPNSTAPTVVIPMDDPALSLYTNDPNDVPLPGVIGDRVDHDGSWGYGGAVRVRSRASLPPITYDDYNSSGASCFSDITDCDEGFGLMFWLEITRGLNDRGFLRHFIKTGFPGIDVWAEDMELTVHARTRTHEYGPVTVPDFTLQRQVWYHITVQAHPGNEDARLKVRINGKIVATVLSFYHATSNFVTAGEITIGSARSGDRERLAFKIDEIVFVESYDFVANTSVWAYALSHQRYGANCSSDEDCLGDNMQCKDDVCQCLEDYAHSLRLDPGDQNLHCARVQQEGKECSDDSDCSFRMICNASSCVCEPGFTYSFLSASCEDVDECRRPSVCGNQTAECTNTYGSYDCICRESGFVWNATTEQCDDVDECSFGNGGCSDQCFNTEGSFTCGCKEGFGLSLEQKICFDLDECLNLTICGDPNEVVCSNTVGSFKCGCKSDGYLWENTTQLCGDIDECERKQGGCSHTCVNTVGSFACSCPTGMSLSNDTLTCLDDDDECLVANGGCSDLCLNTYGSYKCSCVGLAALRGDGRTCQLPDPCADPSVCPAWATCRAAEGGGYVCTCPEGTVWNETISDCENVDECGRDNGGCTHVCLDTEGSFLCQCDEGFTLNLDKKSCKDANECNVKNGGCDHICINTQGSYDCMCRTGYTLQQDLHSCRPGIGKTGFKVRIKFDNVYQDWMSEPSDARTKRLALALENKVDSLGYEAMSSAVNFQGIYVASFTAGSVYANVDILLGENLDGFELSYIASLFREALQNLAIQTDDVTLEATNDNSTVQAIVQNENEDNSTVDVVASCSLVDYQGLCPQNSQCVDVEGNIPICVCSDGYSGETCTITSPGGTEDNGDEDVGTASETVLMLVLVSVLPIIFIVSALFCVFYFNRRRSAGKISDNQYRGRPYSLPISQGFPGYSLPYGNKMLRPMPNVRRW